MQGFAIRLLMLWLAGFPVLASAQLQRWTDDDGVIYYRDVRSTDATAEPTKKTTKKPKRASHSAFNPGRHHKDAARSQLRKQQQEAERQEVRQQKQCARLQARLDRVEHQLAAGYSEPKGNRLRQQRRELNGRLFEECR